MAFSVLMLSGDRTALDAGSAVRARLARYAARMDSLTVVVTGTGTEHMSHDGNIHIVYPGGRTKIENFFKLVRTARSVPMPSVVTAQDPYGIGLVGVLAAWGRAPLQVQVHGALFDSAFTFESIRHLFETVLARVILRCASSVRTVSEKTARAARRATRAPVFVLPVSAEVSQFNVSYARPEEYGDHPVLLAVSRLTHEKNFPLMLDALVRMPTAHLYIAGEGPEKFQVQSYAVSLGVAARVHFLGFKRPIAPYMQYATVVLVTSLYESYCLTLVEAIAAGTPVVSVDVGVARELPPSLITIVDRTPLALAGAVQRVIARPPSEREREAGKAALRALLRSEDETARIFVDSLRALAPR